MKSGGGKGLFSCGQFRSEIHGEGRVPSSHALSEVDLEAAVVGGRWEQYSGKEINPHLELPAWDLILHLYGKLIALIGIAYESGKHSISNLSRWRWYNLCLKGFYNGWVTCIYSKYSWYWSLESVFPALSSCCTSFCWKHIRWDRQIKNETLINSYN